MKQLFASTLVFVCSCTADPLIFPDPSKSDAGQGGASSSVTIASGVATGTGVGGSSSSGGTGEQSGTRLRRYLDTSTDGLSATRPGPYFDALLGVDCVPFQTPMGRRCVPIGQQSILPGHYTDAMCTSPAALLAKGCTQPYLITYTSSQCFGAAGATLRNISLAPSQVAYIVSGATCVMANVSSWDVYSIGSEVDYNAFAEVVTEHE